MSDHTLVRLQQIRAKRSAIQQEIRIRLQWLEDLDSEEEHLWGTPGLQVSGNFTRPLRVGDRVVIGRNDRYYRRTGTIRFPHGDSAWNIKLDPTNQEPASLIQKAERSLLLLADTVFGQNKDGAADQTDKGHSTKRAGTDKKVEKKKIPDFPPSSKW